MIEYMYSKLDLNFSCSKDFLNLNSVVTGCINWRRLLDLIIFSAQFPIIKRFAITLMNCGRQHALWSTKSWLATLLSSLFARWWVGLQTIWRFWLKNLSIDEMVGAWCFGCCQACWMSFVPVFSFIYYWVLIFALYPFYILIYMF